MAGDSLPDRPRTADTSFGTIQLRHRWDECWEQINHSQQFQTRPAA